jgi:TatD DNase family protein
MYFDSHTHIDTTAPTKAAKAALVAEIEASEVGLVIDVGFDMPSSIMCVKNSEEFPWCYAAVGIHPHDADDMTDDDLIDLAELTAQKKVVAIGEMGLDYYRDLSPRDVQQRRFIQQIHLAKELKMPIIIHDRESKGDTISILEEEGAFDTGYGVLLHCFAGDSELARKLAAKGAMISFAGPVTYKKNPKTAEAARLTPLENLLIETDAPYLTPIPHRGEPNKPPYIKYTAEKIAAIRGVDVQEIEEATYNNAKRFFNIK